MVLMCGVGFVVEAGYTGRCSTKEHDQTRLDLTLDSWYEGPL